MLQALDGSALHKVAVIDDDREVRDSYADFLVDLGLKPVPEEGPLGPLDRFVEESRRRSQAAICDHRMKIDPYAGFDGAQLVSEYYQKGFPALLCTRFEEVIDEIRPHRKHIPILLNSEDLDPDTIQFSFERLVAELRGQIPPSRRPWRTLVHVYDVDLDRGFFHIFVPGWDPHKGLRLRIEDVKPEAVRSYLREDSWLHAHVNIGAENHEDLFFEHWEVD